MHSLPECIGLTGEDLEAQEGEPCSVPFSREPPSLPRRQDLGKQGFPFQHNHFGTWEPCVNTSL